VRKSYIETSEGQIHYRTEGTGKPMVLLHYTPVSSDEYTDMIPLLAHDYCVLAMDTPGYGNSDKPPREFTIEDYAQSVVNFLNALRIQKAIVVGHHTGASIAVELASIHPDIVEALVLSGVSLYSSDERELFLRDAMWAPLNITSDGSFLVQQWKYLREWGTHLSPETTFRIFVAMMTAGPRLHDAHYAAFKYVKDQKLPLIKCPTLLVSGTQDMFYKNLKAVEQLIPQCKVQLVEAGNFLGYEKPKEFAEVILEFLKSQQNIR
jgi:pimeloyl-ACP methyl ester carboxylesterase